MGSTDGMGTSGYVDGILDRSESLVTEGDPLLVVATQDRLYQLYTGALLNDRISASALDRVADELVPPALGRGDWCGAVLGATTRLADLLAPAAAPSQASGIGPLGRLPAWLLTLIGRPSGRRSTRSW